MTWVLGSGVPFGYSALISDVRVSGPDGRYLDRLQKIYPIGAGLMAGFAGSVRVGFWMLDAMQRQWGADVGTLYPVPCMAWHWHRFARWLYRERIPNAVKAYGCELMIVGLSPIQHAFGFYSHAVSMRAPDFVPTFVKPDGTWGSIGSGAGHNWAPHFADNNAFMTVFAHGEVMNPGFHVCAESQNSSSDRIIEGTRQWPAFKRATQHGTPRPSPGAQCGHDLVGPSRVLAARFMNGSPAY